MAIEADIRTALLPVAPNRVFPDFAPPSALTQPIQPFIVYTQIGGRPFTTVAGFPGIRNGRFQINVWTSTRLSAMAMIRQIEDVLRESTLLRGTKLGEPTAVFDEPTEMYGAQQDFSIWYR